MSTVRTFRSTIIPTSLRRALMIGTLALFVVAGSVSPALAAGTVSRDSTASIVLSGGTNFGLSSGTIGNGTFNATTLTGAAQTISSSTGFGSTFRALDDRATGAGWNLTAKATQFKNLTQSGKDLVQSSFTMPAVTVAVYSAGSSALPTCLSGPFVIDQAAAQKFVTAPVGAGMGEYTFTVPATGWSLAITADEYSGSYASTITVSWVAGP